MILYVLIGNFFLYIFTQEPTSQSFSSFYLCLTISLCGCSTIYFELTLSSQFFYVNAAAVSIVICISLPSWGGCSHVDVQITYVGYIPRSIVAGSFLCVPFNSRSIIDPSVLLPKELIKQSTIIIWYSSTINSNIFLSRLRIVVKSNCYW